MILGARTHGLILMLSVLTLVAGCGTIDLTQSSQPSVSNLEWWGESDPNCYPPQTQHVYPEYEQPTPDQPTPDQPTPDQPIPDQSVTPIPDTEPEPEFFASADSGNLLGANRVPANIGDFFAPIVETQRISASDQGGTTVDLRTGGAAGFQVGRQKLAENASPIPEDRVFFNYSFFDNVPLTPDGNSVNRFTPGAEKTFFDGAVSIEARFPFATTVDSDVVVGTVDSDTAEFGNITLYAKALLHETDTYALATGLGIAIPTASDISVFDPAESALLEVENESVHLLPYLAAVFTPNDRFFAQALLQFDVDANGNQVVVSGGNALETSGQEFPISVGPTARQDVGDISDQTYVYFNVGAGYWVYRDPCATRGISGIAPRIELHYNASVDDPDSVDFSRLDSSGNSTGLPFVGNVTSGVEDFSLLNLVLGVTVEIGQTSTVTLGYATPVGSKDDKVFDGEFRLLLNHFFGRSTRTSVFAQ